MQPLRYFILSYLQNVDPKVNHKIACQLTSCHTGMLGTKSDIYSFGVILLQVLTGRPPMGLSHYMENAIERGTLPELLDPTVPVWPIEETELLARLALKCTELRRKDRPDLATDILPVLNRLRAIAEANMQHCHMGPGMGTPSFLSGLASVTVS